ncbi:hypothetical protein ACOMHN_065272 [Nucella lapillus]
MTKHSHCVNTFDVIAGKFGTIRKPSPLQGRPLPSWLSWLPGQPTISTTMNTNYTNEETAESDAAKSILASRRSWLFARRRKSVRFSVDDTGTSSVKNTNIQEKWRKYVEQQFKTLKKHKRNRWLGRGQKRRRKLESDFVARNNSDEKGAGPSFANGLDDSSIDVLPSFEYHTPDHKKRKKSLSNQSKNGRSQTITITTTNTTNKSDNRNKKRTTQNQGLPSPDGEPPMLERGVGQNDMTLTSLKEGEEEDLPYLKRPLNAFILFSKACRQEFRNLLVPTFESKVVSMVLGHIWRYLSKEERTTFYHQAEQSRQHFHEEKNKRQHLAIDGQQETNKEEEVLKRPMNGFMLFCQEQRAHLDSKVTGFGAGRRLVRQMARKWHQMKPRVKQVYISRAEEDRKIFCQKKNQSDDQENVTSRDKEGEGDGTEDKPDPDLFQKISKNNNMLGPDPSDTDGSHPQVSMSTVRTSLQCPTVVTSGQQSPDTQAFCISMDADNNDTSGSADETNGPENIQQPSQKTANFATISRTASYETSDPCVAQEGKDKPGRSRRRKKKKPRVRRLKRHVYWKDEIQPWDVFNPVSSALCDEDICTRLYTTPESRDDSWLHTDPVSCHADANSLCQHHPPSFSPRPCSSCLSLGSLKKKVEIAFQKPEIELANWSSSLSSLCDLCSQAIVSDSVSLSSDDSCLYRLLNQCHLSDQNFTNSSFFKSDISSSSYCPYSLNQYYMSTPCDDQTKLGSCMTRSEELCTCNNIQWNKPVRGSNIQIPISHLKKKPNHSSAGRKPCCSSFMQPDESKQEDECCYSRTGKGLRGKGKSCKLFREKSCPTCREYLGKTYLLQNTQTHQPKPDASLSSNCSHCNEIFYSTVICDDVNKNSLTHKASPSMDVIERLHAMLLKLENGPYAAPRWFIACYRKT